MIRGGGGGLGSGRNGWPGGGQTLEWAKISGGSLLSFALEHLSLGRAHLLQTRQDYIPRSLLVRAELYRVRGDLQDAQLSLAMGDKDKAREHLFTIREMIGKIGYHRRDGEVEELEGNGMTKPTVFISYSHKDEKWKDRLRSHLKVLEVASGLMKSNRSWAGQQ